jgi:adenylate cyclase
VRPISSGERIKMSAVTKGVARILVSEDTMRLCGEAFDFIPRGLYKMKGRAQEVELFEPKRKSKGTSA